MDQATVGWAAGVRALGLRPSGLGGRAEPARWAEPAVRSYVAKVAVPPVRGRAEALQRLAEVAPDLRRRGVTPLRIFGSAGRDAMTEGSDVDVLVEFDRPVGAFEFLDLRDDLTHVLGRPVDLETPAAVKERMRARIEREAVVALGRLNVGRGARGRRAEQHPAVHCLPT